VLGADGAVEIPDDAIDRCSEVAGVRLERGIVAGAQHREVEVAVADVAECIGQ